eukprot:scaffold201766_cov26-Prasinocladus_malaysianus.AAC.1
MSDAMLSAQIISNGKGRGAAWHLSHAEVVNTATGEQLVFPFHGWVDKEHGLEHLLQPDRDGGGRACQPNGATVEYQVRIYTSDIWSAGTSANVTVSQPHNTEREHCSICTSEIVTRALT